MNKILTKEFKNLLERISQLESKIDCLEKRDFSSSNEYLKNQNITGKEIDMKGLSDTVATEISYSNAASRNLQQKTVPEQKASKITKILKEDIQHGSKPVGHVENTAEGWKTVSRQRKRVPVIFGSSNEDTAIKAAVKYSHYHVYRLQPNIKCEQLEMHLKNKNIDNVKCTKITSKHPDEYSSFKVTVPARYENIIQDPATWPQDVCINRFLARLWKENKVTT